MDTFCVLPWYSVELPRNNPCCLLPKDTDIDQLKNHLLNGVKSPACAKCWTLESNGQRSRRQYENDFLDYKLNTELTELKNQCANGTTTPLVYQIKTSNLCNQACVTCDSRSSTRWARYEEKMGIKPAPFFKIDLQKTQIDYARARRVSFVGGEPFFDSQTFDILEQLIQHNNTDCFITFITNGSVTLNQTQLDILSRFSDLNVCFSIDGINSVFEYMRWPGNWDTLIHNLKQMQELTTNISVSYTISSVNVLYYQETIEWFRSQNLKYNHNLVTNPSWLSLDCMPVEIKQLVTDVEFARPWTKITGKEISLTDYYNKLHAQDLAKNIDIKNYLPELAVIFDSLTTTQ